MMDIFTRIDGWLAMLRYGPGVELRWLGIGAPVIRLLHRYGIKTYMPTIPKKGMRAIRVPAAQARWAEYLCFRAGMPMVGLIDNANANVKRGPMPKAWGVPARSVGFAGAVFNLFEGLYREIR